MAIILFCVFGISSNSTGIVKSAPVTVTEDVYEQLRYEEGHEAKLALCKETFGEQADLAWLSE
jgi:hypothetical protein